MMKKLFIACAAFVWTIALVAQNISVVNSDGSTKLYRTLQAAIEGADPNSVIYLPGGCFPIADSVKITKKLTIIGIGHKAKNDNVDGVTTISGNLFFNEGSSGSAVMACYITGNVNIGEGGASVNDVLIRYCNLNSVQVNNSTCQETVVNQNYIRNGSAFGNSSAKVTNNVIHSIAYIDGGTISRNIITGYYQTVWSSTAYGDVFRIIEASNSFIGNNIMIGNGKSKYGSNAHVGGANNQIIENMSKESVGEACVIINTDWSEVFNIYNGGAINPTSDFHFKDDYKQYENIVGIYADGVDFDKQLAPVPYIVAKKIDDQTDASGKLNIKIRVKASGEE